MIEFKERVKEIFKDAGTFLKWVLFACIIGIVVGLVGVLFHYCIEMAAGLRNTYNWLIWLLPLGGVTIILMYRYLKMEKDRGTNFVLIAVRANEKLPLKTAPLIFISTVITHLFGGSSGREGAALQLGGSISAQIGRWMHLDDKDSRIITMCGMSAAFSALFGTPLTAAIFSMEVISVGIMYYSAIVPCVLASVIGAFISSLFSIGPAHYIIVGIPDINALTILQVLGLAFVCALLSILFCIIMHKSSAFCSKFLPNPIICIVLAGFMIVGLTYIVGVNDYNGAGMDVISRAIGG